MEPTWEQIAQRAERLCEGVAQLEAKTMRVVKEYGITIKESGNDE